MAKMALSPLRIRSSCLCHRSYSVRAVALKTQPANKDKTLADLKSWIPDTPDPEVQVYGHVRSKKKLGQVSFVNITDGSSMRPVQAVVPKSLAAGLSPGSAIRMDGMWHIKSRNPASAQANNVPASDQQAQSAELSDETDSLPSTALDQITGRARLSTDAAASSSGLESENQVDGELQVSHVEILGPSDAQTNPIQNKYQSPESLRNIPHLRPRMPLNSTLLRLRSNATAILVDYFYKRGFQQCHPPIITSSDCEGAGEAFSVKAGSPEEFFRDTKYLTVSSQLHLEAFSQALGNVWTLSPTFRAEQSDTSRHLSEFYMLEAEMSFVTDMNDVMDLAQDMLRSLTLALQTRSASVELKQNRETARDPIERSAYQDLVDREQLQRRWRGLTASSTWPRVSYTQAVELLKASGESFEHEVTWGRGLQSEHEKYLAEKIGYDNSQDAYLPVFITNYPRDIKAFYMLQSAQASANGPTVDCFDLIVPHMGELAGGSMREHRLEKLEENMRLHGLEVPKKRDLKGNSLSWYLDLRRWGSPPHGGFGLGFDRLLSYLTGVQNVRDVVPFPRYHGRCDC